MRATFKNRHPSVISLFTAVALANVNDQGQYTIKVDGLAISIAGNPDDMWHGPYASALLVLKKIKQQPTDYFSHAQGMEWYETMEQMLKGDPKRLTFAQAVEVGLESPKYAKLACLRADVKEALVSARLLKNNRPAAMASLTKDEFKAANAVMSWV